MLNNLDLLEAESIEILLEATATAANPVLLYSIGKDSSVLLHLALKRFIPRSRLSRFSTSIPRGNSQRCIDTGQMQ